MAPSFSLPDSALHPYLPLLAPPGTYLFSLRGTFIPLWSAQHPCLPLLAPPGTYLVSLRGTCIPLWSAQQPHNSGLLSLASVMVTLHWIVKKTWNSNYLTYQSLPGMSKKSWTCLLHLLEDREGSGSGDVSRSLEPSCSCMGLPEPY